MNKAPKILASVVTWLALGYSLLTFNQYAFIAAVPVLVATSAWILSDMSATYEFNKHRKWRVIAMKIFASITLVAAVVWAIYLTHACTFVPFEECEHTQITFLYPLTIDADAQTPWIVIDRCIYRPNPGTIFYTESIRGFSYVFSAIIFFLLEGIFILFDIYIDTLSKMPQKIIEEKNDIDIANQRALKELINRMMAAEKKDNQSKNRRRGK